MDLINSWTQWLTTGGPEFVTWTRQGLVVGGVAFLTFALLTSLRTSLTSQTIFKAVITFIILTYIVYNYQLDVRLLVERWR